MSPFSYIMTTFLLSRIMAKPTFVPHFYGLMFVSQVIWFDDSVVLLCVFIYLCRYLIVCLFVHTSYHKSCIYVHIFVCLYFLIHCVLKLTLFNFGINLKCKPLCLLAISCSSINQLQSSRPLILTKTANKNFSVIRSLNLPRLYTLCAPIYTCFMPFSPICWYIN